MQWAEIIIARQLRLEHHGAVCHLSICGNARETIFSYSENRDLLLESLDNAINRQTKDFCGLLCGNQPCYRETGVWSLKSVRQTSEPMRLSTVRWQLLSLGIVKQP